MRRRSQSTRKSGDGGKEGRKNSRLLPCFSRRAALKVKRRDERERVALLRENNFVFDINTTYCETEKGEERKETSSKQTKNL